VIWWVKLIEQNVENTHMPSKFNLQKDLTERVGTPRISTMSADDDTKDIKNIYVDSKLLFFSSFYNYLLTNLSLLNYCMRIDL